MKKHIYKYIVILMLWFVTFSLFTNKVNASEYFIHAEPLSLNLITEANNAINSSMNLISPKLNDLYIYPFAFDWKLTKDKFNFEISSWFKFEKDKIHVVDASDYPVNFSVKPPEDTAVGEYYKVVALSSTPFTCDATANPPTMIGIPATVQIIKGLPIGSTTETGTGNGLISKVTMQNYSQSFNLFEFTQDIRFEVKNEGNISAVPTGQVYVKDLNGKVIDKFNLNPSGLALEPNQTQQFKFKFKSDGYLVGLFRSEVWLGHQSSQLTLPEDKKVSQMFFYISAKAVLAFILTILFAYAVEKILSVPEKVRVRFLRYYILLLFLLPVLFLTSLKPAFQSQTLGITTALPPQSQNVEVKAAVKDTVGLRIDPQDPHKVYVTSDSPKGWKLWSFRCKWPYVIAESNEANRTPKEVILNDSEAQYPLLLVPKIYF